MYKFIIFNTIIEVKIYPVQQSKLQQLQYKLRMLQLYILILEQLNKIFKKKESNKIIVPSKIDKETIFEKIFVSCTNIDVQVS